MGLRRGGGCVFIKKKGVELYIKGCCSVWGGVVKTYGEGRGKGKIKLRGKRIGSISLKLID